MSNTLGIDVMFDIRFILILMLISIVYAIYKVFEKEPTKVSQNDERIV